MTPATWPRPDALAERLLRIDPRARRYRDALFGDLPEELRRGDLLVVNDAATLPASLPATSPSGRAVEVRLLRQNDASGWDAVLFGEGDWRARTEHRPAPERLEPGEAIVVGGELRAVVERVSPLSPRLVLLRFERAGADLWSALYRHGRPVQYSYLRGPLELWRVQTAYGARPWAAELPSAGRPLRWGLLRAIREKGVGLASLTHAAGLSSTGDPAIDAALPFPERYDIPERTAEAVEATHAVGGRVVAVGTTVARALEGGAARNGSLEPGTGETDLRIGAGFRARIVDGLLTGLHEPGTSHFELLQAFAPLDLLQEAFSHAEAVGYLGHEFGDSSLVLPG